MKLNRLIRGVFCASLLLSGAEPVFAQGRTLQAFALKDIRLEPGPFKAAQQTDLNYILALDADRLLAPFLREAGLKIKAESYGNWENTGLDGHIGGHYLSALANMYASTGDRRLAERMKYMLSELRRCQRASGDGYVGGIPGSKQLWKEIKEGKIRAGAFSLNDKWVPLYNIHKLFAGLVDAYQTGGFREAREILLPLSEWFYRTVGDLSDQQVQEMLRSEFGGLNEAFADISVIAQDRKFLTLSERLAHHAILDPLARGEDRLNGLHANTQIPKVIGFVRTAELNGDERFMKAGRYFWERVVNMRSISIGGNSVREHFNPFNDFSSMLESREGPETCNSYNMLKLSRHLFLDDGSSRYVDFYERTMYNHILSSQHPEGGFVYFTPIRPEHYRMYSEPQKSFWCCVGSGLENHGKYGELIYAHSGNDLYVNLFIPSVLSWKEKGISVKQSGLYPFSNTSELNMTLRKPESFKVLIRKPAYLGSGGLKISVNGKPAEIQEEAGAYFALERHWKSGDRVGLTFDLQPRAEQLPDKSDWLSFLYGPLVLAAKTEAVPHSETLGGGSRMGHIASGAVRPLDEAPMLVGNGDFAAGLKQLTTDSLQFSPASMLVQEKFGKLVLQPFYQIHDARYVMYFPFTGPEKLAEVQQSMKLREAEKMAVEAATIDLIHAGEQQPESDHQLQSEDSQTGIFAEEHFRKTRAWFSYELKNPAREARTLRIKINGADYKQGFGLSLNGRERPYVSLNEFRGQRFAYVYVPLNEAESAELLKVRISAPTGGQSAGIYEVRLMKQKIIVARD